jgi:hypothetical protein
MYTHKAMIIVILHSSCEVLDENRFSQKENAICVTLSFLEN